MEIELKREWFNLLNKLEADLTIGKTIFQELITAHTNVSRHYHNLDHVRHLLTLADSIREMAECFEAIELAAWFHDYVYDSQAQDNEIKSAIYATETLTRLNLDSDLIDLVKQIILSTQRHQPLLNTVDNLLFLDLDLSILGAAGDRYLKYAQAIRKEYSWLSDSRLSRGKKTSFNQFFGERKDLLYRLFLSEVRTTGES